MAFGFKLGGSKSVLERLQEGAFKSDEEKQKALKELAESNRTGVELVPLIALDDSTIASRASQLFLTRADPKAVAALVTEGLFGEQGRSNVIKTLQKCKDELIVAALEPILERPKPDQARKIWEFTLELQTSVSDRYLPRALKEATGNSRLVALRRSVKGQGPESMRPILIDCTGDQEVALRKEALNLLSTLTGEDVFACMLDRLGSDDSSEVRELAGKWLQEYIGKAPPEIRPKVLGKLLVSMAPEQQKQLCASMFNSPQRDDLLKGVLIFCKTLTGSQHQSVMNALKTAGEALIPGIKHFLAAPEADLRIQAAYLLEAFADPRHTPLVVGLLRDPDWWVRIVVCDALGRMGDLKVIPALQQMIFDPDAKWAAIDAIGALGGDQAITTLMPLLADPIAEVRSAAVTAFQKISDPRVEKILADVSTRDPSIDVRLKAVDAMRSLTGKAGTGSVVTSQQLTKPIEKLLAYARERGASDLHITPGEPAVIRVNGGLIRLENMKPFETHQTEAVLMDLLDAVRKPLLLEHGTVDFCYAIPGVGRYRANVMKMKRGYSGVFRVIPMLPPGLAELGLPKHLSEICTFHQGIVLVTGPAGCGKTNTLTALVNLINETRSTHVLTFEDPVEFIHVPKKALINQREIGRDSLSYAAAMRGALREDPDVIVVGDMRDAETIRLALLAAETGHLVIATMQTTGAVATIDKLVESFPTEEQQQTRVSLSESLKLVVSQLLLPRADQKGRLAVFEVLKSTSSVRSLIRDGKTFQLTSAMTIGRGIGMQTLDSHIEERWRAGLVTFETALEFAQSKDGLEKQRAAKPIAQAGASTTAAPATSPAAPARPSAPRVGPAGTTGAPPKPAPTAPPGQPPAGPARKS